MAHNVYQVAMEEGVKRVVVASSNHAADFYEPLIHSGRESHDPKLPSLGGLAPSSNCRTAQSQAERLTKWRLAPSLSPI